jgi:hypothetical protein
LLTVATPPRFLCDLAMASLMRDHAQKVLKELKGRFPMLQIKICDAENERREEMELATA